MRSYTKEEIIAMNFWYELDYNTFSYFEGLTSRDNIQYCNVSPAVKTSLDLIRVKPVIDGKPLYEVYREYNDLIDYIHFKEELDKPVYKPVKDAVDLISGLILSFIHRNFVSNRSVEQRVFELFGQGTLFDNLLNHQRKPRRPPEFRIHRIDGGTGSFYEWHMFIRIAEILQLPKNHKHVSSRWLDIDRYIGLAADINNLMQPAPSDENGTDPENPFIDGSVLITMQNKWTNLDFQQIDDELKNLL
jgi:hypothetical protein